MRPSPNPKSDTWKSSTKLDEAFVIDSGEGFVASPSQPFQYIGGITIQYVGPTDMSYV